MDISEHIDALRQQGSLLADAAERGGLDASIPPCPSWQVKDLLRHTGYIHRWAARHAHETAIHRADADSASGVQPDYEPDFAADGIDELITGFAPRRKYRPPAAQDGGMRGRA